MSILAAAACALLVQQNAPTTKTFVSREHGIQLEIPAEWRVSRERVRQLISFATAAGPARIEIFATEYTQPADSWQQLQLTVNQQMERTVVRQWDEEILSVPMLLTRVNYRDDRAGDTSLLIGLLYTNTKEKFHFRLLAPQVSYDQVESQWRTALLSMRTLTGSLPTKEDGTVNAAPAVPAPDPTRTLSMSSVPMKTAPLGSVRHAFTVSNRSGVLRLPSGTKVEAISPLTLRIDGIPSTIKADIFSNVDSPASGIVIMEEANRDLNRFSAVTLRENFGPKRNSVGQQEFMVARTGTSEGKDLLSIHGVVDSGDFYLRFSFESRDKERFSEIQRNLRRWLDRTGFEKSK